MLTKSCYTSQGSRQNVAVWAHAHTRGHTCSHACAHMYTRRYLSRPSWETQPSQRATLPGPPESKQQQERGESEEEREPLGRQEVHRRVAAGAALGRRRKAGEGRGVISWPWDGCWAWAGVITEALGRCRPGRG